MASARRRASCCAAPFLQGDLAAARKVYDDALATLAGKGVEGSGSYAFAVVAYAQFLVQACSDAEAARALFEQALGKLPGSRTLWEGAIHLEETLASTPVRLHAAIVSSCCMDEWMGSTKRAMTTMLYIAFM